MESMCIAYRARPETVRTAIAGHAVAGLKAVRPPEGEVGRGGGARVVGGSGADQVVRVLRGRHLGVWEGEVSSCAVVFCGRGAQPSWGGKGKRGSAGVGGRWRETGNSWGRAGCGVVHVGRRRKSPRGWGWGLEVDGRFERAATTRRKKGQHLIWGFPSSGGHPHGQARPSAHYREESQAAPRRGPRATHPRPIVQRNLIRQVPAGDDCPADPLDSSRPILAHVALDAVGRGEAELAGGGHPRVGRVVPVVQHLLPRAHQRPVRVVPDGLAPAARPAGAKPAGLLGDGQPLLTEGLKLGLH
eukprot:scaffold6532_cov116-Isochrysis_galbana.AAC.14